MLYSDSAFSIFIRLARLHAHQQGDCVPGMKRLTVFKEQLALREQHGVRGVIFGDLVPGGVVRGRLGMIGMVKRWERRQGIFLRGRQC